MTLEPCALEVVGVAGSLPIFGRGTAVFVLTLKGGEEILVRIHNCLYSFGEFNLLSVSQMQALTRNVLNLSLDSPRLRLYGDTGSGDSSPVQRQRQFVDIPLIMDDGLYCLHLNPISTDDCRFHELQMFDITPPGEYEPATQRIDRFCGAAKTMLPLWTTCAFYTSPPTGRIYSLNGAIDFHANLKSFSDEFLAPAGLPPARKQYDVSNSSDMSDLSIRFLGGGTDRILHTVDISNGLKCPPSKKHARVPPLNFPQGNMKQFKTPRVSKDIVGPVCEPAIAEILYTDTFETGDLKFPYAQVFVDRTSRYGDVIPLRSRTEIGQAFVTFVCRHFTPLILISDNISENQGGDLVEQCRQRDVKQLFTCPYHPQQDFAESYIGRITTMASFGMVYSGAPLFMWVWAVKTAVFVDHIMATFYSKQNVWATPYELVHGELFPDASVVVPFGCGVLVLLTEKERAKFKSRCALMIFVHYADSHPLYTYAVYSPRTRKVLMRQDCIFLTKLFPMRVVRAATGMGPNGEALHPIRSPMGTQQYVDPELSFADWSPTDPLPQYEDHVTSWKLHRPNDSEIVSSRYCDGASDSAHDSGPDSGPGDTHFPSHPAFGAISTVPVRTPIGIGSGVSLVQGDAPRTPDATVNMDPRGEGFSIWLVYPGTSREPHLLRVYVSMLVHELYEMVATMILHCAPTDFHLMVHQQHLSHAGRITDQLDPVTLLPTCFLGPRSVVSVRMVSTSSPLLLPDGFEGNDLITSEPDDDDTACPDSAPSDESEDAVAHSVSTDDVIRNDPELTNLYRQLATLNDEILARWVVLLRSASPNQLVRRHDRDTTNGSDALLPGGGSSSTALVPNNIQRRVSTREPVKRKPYVGGSGGGACP
jgi:hypothetical protein